MTRFPDWTIEEFEILLNHNDLSGEQLAELLPRRTPDAVEVVRQGIHRFHATGDGSMLSEIMRQRIRDKHQSLTCPKCGARI
jgi:hypothetical protein